MELQTGVPSTLAECYLGVVTWKIISVDFMVNNWQPAASPFPVIFLQAPVNNFIFFFLSYSPTIPQRYFRVLSVNIILPYLDF